MSLKLVTYPASFRSQKIIITAELAKVNLEVDLIARHLERLLDERR